MPVKFVRKYLSPLHDVATLAWAIAIILGSVGGAVYYFLPSAERALDWVVQTATGIDLDIYLAAPVRDYRSHVALVLGLLFIILFLSFRRSYIYRRRTRHVVDALREALRAHIEFMSKTAGSENRQADQAKEFLSLGLSLCNRISEIFQTLTRCQCHTTIKSFDRYSGIVKTRCRDTLLHNDDRRKTDEGRTTFKIEDHTAFKSIVDDPQQYMFVSNWLRLLAWRSKYTNKNPDWRDYYRATVVLPITMNRNQSEINRESVIGFVTVDNKCGRFDAKVSRAVLSLFSTMIYDAMIKLDRQIQPSS